MDDLVTWLRARFDDDERAALETGASDHPAWHVLVTDDPSSPTPVQAAHMTRHGPWRVRREVDAKRRILDRCAEAIGDRNLSGYDQFGSLADEPNALALFLAVETMRDLTLPYADRDGYRDEWKPA